MLRTPPPFPDTVGNLELDRDNGVWTDYPAYMEMNTPETRRDNPEGFTWECCDRPADAPGCTPSWHQQGGAKRARLDIQPPVVHISSDEDDGSSGEDDGDDDETVTDESEEEEEAEGEKAKGEGEAEDDGHTP